MNKLLVVVSLLLAATPAFAEEGKTCAAIKSCDVTQVAQTGRKKSTTKNKLTIDYLCDADVHSLPLKGGMELELAIVKNHVVAKLNSAGATVVTKKAAVDAKKIVIKHQAKDKSSVAITCKS